MAGKKKKISGGKRKKNMRLNVFEKGNARKARCGGHAKEKAVTDMADTVTIRTAEETLTVALVKWVFVTKTNNVGWDVPGNTP